jgi:hypothetical protein
MIFTVYIWIFTLNLRVFISGPIASIFWLDKELGSDIFLDGMCCYWNS